MVGSTQAAILTVSSYSYNTAPHASYPDTGGIELTDGITDTTLWGVPNPPVIDAGPVVGWFNADPDITFNFDSTVNVNSITLWFADSEGSAGVGLPTSVGIFENGVIDLGDFAVTNPAGSGTTVPITINGLNTTGNSFRIEATRDFQWTMLSEVQFEGAVVPEPSTYALILGTATFLFIARKRYLSKRA